jgi:uncharacterized protein (UPF0335 family)
MVVPEWVGGKQMGLSKQKYLLSAAAMALAVPAMSAGALAYPALDAVLERLDRLEKENAKLKGEMKKIENKGTANASANGNGNGSVKAIAMKDG